MQRLIVLDTETTGLDPKRGHKLVEVACLELIDFVPGKHYQQYINPERDVPPEVTNIHGLTIEFLQDFPKFDEVVQDFWSFIGDDQLIIHNAAFDLGFLNMELSCADYPVLDRGRVIDTLLLARKKFPGSPCNLDALCKRFDICLKDRTLHGALIDVHLLSKVYIELMGGVQRKLSFLENNNISNRKRLNVPKRRFSVADEEKQVHAEFMRRYFNIT